MSKSISSLLILFFVFISLGFGIYNFLRTPKIAYVRSHDLIYKYQGTKEAQSKFEAKKESWQANIDTLTADLKKSINRYTQESSKMAFEDKKEMEKYLQTQEQQLMAYSEAIEQKAKEEDDKMMQGVLNQVNSYVEEYGKKNGYDIILGTTLSGNVLYGESYLDITDDLLRELNEKYKGKE